MNNASPEQNEIQCLVPNGNEGKSLLSSWEVMKEKIRAQFLPADHEMQLFKKLQSLKQREMDMNTYMEEFHRLILRAKKQEEEPERVASYLNGLGMSI